MGCCLSKLDIGKPSPDFQTNLVAMESDMDDYYQRFKELAVVGEGITGSVSKIESLATRKQYAVKSINLDKVHKAQIKELKTEIRILKALDHPNIVHLHQVYQNKNNIKVIMELLTGGDLSQRVLGTEDEVRRIIFQIVSACIYCHSQGVVHRDLKLQNVLFINSDPGSDIKIIDFGLGGRFITDELMQQILQQRREALEKVFPLAKQRKSRRMKRAPVGVESPKGDFSPADSKTNLRRIGSKAKGDSFHKLTAEERRKMMKSRIFQTTCGTAYYMAPEVLCQEGYSEKCDLWAIGVIAYMLIVLKPPFAGNKPKEVFRAIRECNPSYRASQWNLFSPQAMQFVRHLLVANPNKRWNAQQALQSPWLQECRNPPKDVSNSLESNVVRAMERFSHYSLLKQMALMVIAHNQPSSYVVSLDRLFLAIDENSTGHLEWDNFYNFVRSTDPNLDGDDIRNIFENVDQRGMDKIGRMEFLAATIEVLGTITVGMVYEAFHHLDISKRGYISMKEIRKLCGNRLSKREANDVFNEFSTVGDKKITQLAFLKFMMEDIDAGGEDHIEDNVDDDDENYFSFEEEEEEDGEYTSDVESSEADSPGVESGNGTSLKIETQV